jgi:excisionase family DNA binding protein
MTSEQVTLSPEDVAERLGTSAWWVREQARRGRIPHLRLGKQRIRLLPEHVDALVALFTVRTQDHDGRPTPQLEPVRVDALGATARSTAAHARRPHLMGDTPLF